MKKTIILLILIKFLSIAFADESKPNEKWFQCSVNEDCIEIEYTCAGDIINKIYAKEANEYYQKLNARIECVRKAPSEDQKRIQYKVFCKSNKCGVQGINPKKPGFS